MSTELITRDEFATIQGLAKTFLGSGLFKDTQSVEAAVVKMMAGRELKMGPFEAMRNINVIQGQVTLTAGCIAARIKGSGKYDYRIVKNEDDCCELEFFQDGKAVGTSKFDKADATAAGLLGKDVWKKYPRNMYFARALTNGARWYCAEVFGGPIYTPEELGKANAIDAQATEVAPAKLGMVIQPDEIKMSVRDDYEMHIIETKPPKKNLSHGGIHKTVDPNITLAEAKDLDWDGDPEKNPELWVIEGLPGCDAKVVGKAVMEVPLKKLENAMKPKFAAFTTDRDKVNIGAVLASLDKQPKPKPEPVKVEQTEFDAQEYDGDEIPE